MLEYRFPTFQTLGYPVTWASQVALVVKNLPANAGNVRDLGSIPGLEDPLEEGMATHCSTLAYLENFMERAAWQATVHGVTESDTTERLRSSSMGLFLGSLPCFIDLCVRLLKIVKHCRIVRIFHSVIYKRWNVACWSGDPAVLHLLSPPWWALWSFWGPASLSWGLGGEGGGRVGVFYPTGYTYHAQDRTPHCLSPRAEHSCPGGRQGEAIWGLLGRQKLVHGLWTRGRSSLDLPAWFSDPRAHLQRSR